MKIAIVDKYPTKINYSDYFDFEYEVYHLIQKKVNKILKADITLDLNTDNYEYIIVIGAEPAKFVAGITSVVSKQGLLIDNKFLPLISPNMLAFKPASKPSFDAAVAKIHSIVNGERLNEDKYTTILIDNSDKLNTLLSKCNNEDYIALDCETSALYPRDGYVLGISITLSSEPNTGYYIISEVIDDEIAERLQQVWNDTIVVFHNAKFDIKFLNYYFNWTFPDFEDTILLHYCLNETPGIHGLKDLSIKFTDLGDYEQELDSFKRDFCKSNGLLLSGFSYELIPQDIMVKYAAKDTIATSALFLKFYDRVINSKVGIPYKELLKPGTIALNTIEENGVPFSKRALLETQQEINDYIIEERKNLYTFSEVKKLEKVNGKIFNPNSPAQVRDLLFNYCGLPTPDKFTETGAISTDEEVLSNLAKNYEIAQKILNIRKSTKIKSTYVDKILLGLDKDSRLRTFFNLYTTLSGRLSSSGKLNMQQTPRKDKRVKRCIRARDGWKIVSQDLKTAEMYIAAVLSGDRDLQSIFINGDDYHGMMAKYKFNLPCDANDIARLYPDERQSAKTISFEILYKLNLREPVLQKFPTLKRWLNNTANYIEENGYAYQAFNRKRRLPNVFSSNRDIKQHEIRSGVNALVQGPSSDINLFAAIEMVEYIKETNMRALPFALVHDSIVAEVPDEEIEEYTSVLKEITQKDRGLSIPGCPIGVDVEIGQDYSFT